MAKAVCWRIHPQHHKILQLLDENDQETHRFQTAEFKNNITWNGHLEVKMNDRSYYFLRDNKDRIAIYHLGFKNPKTARYISEKSTYDMIDFEQVKSWRTRPGNAETLQLLDEMNEVMHEEPMLTASGERVIFRDTIEFSSKGTKYHIKKLKSLPATADILNAMWEDSDSEEEDSESNAQSAPSSVTAEMLQTMWEDSDTEEEGYDSEAELLMIDEDAE